MTSRRIATKSVRSEWVQKYALLLAIIGTPTFAVAQYMHTGPRFIIWSSILIILVFSASLASTLYSGIGYGANFERIERKAKPGRYWLVVGAHVFVCVVGAFGISQGMSGYTMK